MSKKKGNNSSKKQQNNGVLNHQPIALGLIRRTLPELFSNVLVGVDQGQRQGVDPMTPEERAKWEKEWRERWKEKHIDDIKHNGDFWQL